jgi:site-specific DNA recombinase
MNQMIEKVSDIKFVSLYQRVSTSNQEDANTVQNQGMVLDEYVKSNGLVVVEKYIDEGWSGDTLARPALDRMRQDARDKKWGAVIIYDPDRLARRYSYQELIVDELRDLGIEVIFTTIPAPKNSEDKILYGVRGLFAEYERTKIAERFRLGKLRTVKEGHVIGSEAPYGYRYIRKNKENGIMHGRYEILDDEARVVRMIYSWIANDDLTIRGVVRKLQELNIKPRKSKRGVWATSTLNHLLANSTYKGEAQWGKSYATVPVRPLKEEKYKKCKKSSRKLKPVEEWISIKVPPIIDGELFYKARARLQLNIVHSKRKKKYDYLLTGKIWCVCGKRRCGNGPHDGKNLYYNCSDKARSFPFVPSCKEKSINARISDQLVWENISNLMKSPVLMQSQIKQLLGETQNVTNLSLFSLNDIKKEIDKLSVKRERYNKAYADGLFTLEKLREYTGTIVEKIKSLENESTQVKNDQQEMQSTCPSQYELEEYTKTATKKLKDLSFEAKRAIVMSVVKKVVATQEKLQIHGFIPINTNVTFCPINRHGRNTIQHSETKGIPFYFDVKVPLPLKRGVDYGFRKGENWSFTKAC